MSTGENCSVQITTRTECSSRDAWHRPLTLLFSRGREVEHPFPPGREPSFFFFFLLSDHPHSSHWNKYNNLFVPEYKEFFFNKLYTLLNCLLRLVRPISRYNFFSLLHWNMQTRASYVFVTARIRLTRLESFSKFSLNGLPFVVYRYTNFTTLEFN